MSSVYMELRKRITKIPMTWRYTCQKKEMNIGIGDGEIDRVPRADRGNSNNSESRPIIIEFS